MTSGIIALGRGRLSGASKVGGEVVVILNSGGVLKKLTINGTAVTDRGTVGGGDDCYIFEEGKVFFDPEVRYEAGHS